MSRRKGIPALFDVGHCVHNGGGSFSEPAGWAAPVTKKFITWAAYNTTEPKRAGHDRDVVDAGIVVYPPDSDMPDRWFGDAPKPQDRMIIDGVTYEVIGHPERNDKVWRNANVANWVINLQAVNG